MGDLGRIGALGDRWRAVVRAIRMFLDPANSRTLINWPCRDSSEQSFDETLRAFGQSFQFKTRNFYNFTRYVF